MPDELLSRAMRIAKLAPRPPSTNWRKIQNAQPPVKLRYCKPLTMQGIAEIVADFYGVTIKELRGHSRKDNFVIARWITSYFCRVLRDIPYSYPQIGRFLEHDHSSVLHGVRKIEKQRHTDAVIAADLNVLLNKFDQLLVFDLRETHDGIGTTLSAVAPTTTLSLARNDGETT